MDRDLKPLVGARVRAARIAAGMTQEALAEMIGRTPESVSNIERGQQLPSLDTVARMGEALNVDALVLVADISLTTASTKERAALEARAAGVMRRMPDDVLSIAVRQLEAFLGN